MGEQYTGGPCNNAPPAPPNFQILTVRTLKAKMENSRITVRTTCHALEAKSLCNLPPLTPVKLEMDGRTLQLLSLIHI